MGAEGWEGHGGGGEAVGLRLSAILEKLKTSEVIILCISSYKTDHRDAERKLFVTRPMIHIVPKVNSPAVPYRKARLGSPSPWQETLKEKGGAGELVQRHIWTTAGRQARHLPIARRRSCW